MKVATLSSLISSSSRCSSSASWGCTASREQVAETNFLSCGRVKDKGPILPALLPSTHPFLARSGLVETLLGSAASPSETLESFLKEVYVKQAWKGER